MDDERLGGSILEELEMVSFKVISASGAAKSLFMEAMQHARKREFEEAEGCIREGEESRQKGHEAHFELIQNEASGNPVPINLLLMHAEDQLMAAETIKIMAEEIIENYKAISYLERKIK